jgi:predicted small secreted protein
MTRLLLAAGALLCALSLGACNTADVNPHSRLQRP